MRSASPYSAAGILVLLMACALLLVGTLSGCQTTQETAAKKQAESKRFLEAREKQREKRSKSDDKGGQER